MDEQVPPVEQTQSSNDKLRALLAAQGIELTGSDEDIAQSLSGAIKTNRELQERLNEERSRAERIEQEYTQRIAASQKPAEQPQVQKPKKWERIDVAPELQSLVVKDKTNDVWVPKPGTGVAGIHAAEQINSAERERTIRAERIIQSPFEVLREAGLDEYLSEQLKSVTSTLEEKIRSQLEAQMSARQQATREAEIEKLRGEYRKDVFALNDRGEIKLDVHGNPVLTELGKVFTSEIADLLESGMDDVLAMKKGFEIAKYKTSAMPQPESKKQEFVQQARSASVADAGARKPQTAKSETPEFRSLGFIEFVKNSSEYKQLAEAKK